MLQILKKKLTSTEQVTNLSTIKQSDTKKNRVQLNRKRILGGMLPEYHGNLSNYASQVTQKKSCKQLNINI